MFEAKIEAGYLIIKIPANTTNPPLSSTQKSRNVSSTHGFQPAPALTVNGQPVKINLTAIIPAR